MPLAKIEQRGATDEVHQAVRDAILTRVFSPGQRLNVEDLAANLGVSFTPVRQALQLLAAGKRLIVIQPRSGTYVATLWPQEAWRKPSIFVRLGVPGCGNSRCKRDRRGLGGGEETARTVRGAQLN